MKKLFVIMTVLTLLGCANSESEFVNNRVLRDSTSCAFITQRGVGSVIFLHHVKELSGPECEFNE